jgi:Ferritin-like domain
VTRNRPEPMAISEAELTSMTRELHDAHESSFGGVRATLAEFADNLGEARRAALSRRGLLMGGGGIAAAAALAACGASSTALTGATSVSASSSAYTGDLKVVALAAAMENLAITAYDGALKAAGAGTLGTVPPAIATFITTARKQHSDHADAWNGVLSKASLPIITGAPLTVTDSTMAALGKATTVTDVAKLALSLEMSAAATYTFATANVKDAGGIMTAATIQPVEAMHAAILNFVLGQYPVPVSFIGTDTAVKLDALTR